MTRNKLAVAMAVLGMLAGCGTRLPDEAFVDASGSRGVSTDTAAAGSPSATLPDGRPVEPGAPTTVAGGAGPTVLGGGPTPTSTGVSDATATPAGPNQASDVGVTETTIRIGTIVAENGVLGDAFAPAVRGLRAWVASVNAAGGIRGRTVELFTCDDHEDRARNLECARRLVEDDQVFALLDVNTRSTNGSAQYLNDSGTPVLGFPITNAFRRFPHFWAIYPDGYVRDGQTVGHAGQIISQTGNYRWFREHLGVSRAAVFAYDIAESAQAADFMQQGLELEGYTVTRYNVSFAAPAFDQPVADMQRNGIEIIFDALDDGANRRLCDAMSRRGFTVEAKVSTIVAFGESMGADFPESCRNVTFITGDSRPYTDTSVPIIAEFNEAMARYQRGVELHQWALEAWVQPMMLRDYLIAVGPAPTRAGFEDFLRNLDDYTAEGIMKGDQIDYRPRDYDSPTRRHCFSTARWLDDAGGWVRATDPFPFCYEDAGQFGTPALENGT